MELLLSVDDFLDSLGCEEAWFGDLVGPDAVLSSSLVDLRLGEVSSIRVKDTARRLFSFSSSMSRFGSSFSV